MIVKLHPLLHKIHINTPKTKANKDNNDITKNTLNSSAFKISSDSKPLVHSHFKHTIDLNALKSSVFETSSTVVHSCLKSDVTKTC